MSAAPPPSVAVAKPQGPSPAEQCARIIRIVREHDPAASLALPNAIAPQISVGALHHMTETYADLTTAVREALVLGLVVASAKWRSRLESGDVDQAAAKAFQEAAVAVSVSTFVTVLQF